LRLSWTIASQPRSARQRCYAALGLFALTVGASVSAWARASPSDRSRVDAVVIHPLVHPHFMCLEHPTGQLTALGDALGSDCLVTHLRAGVTAQFPALYRSTGERNEDWYGWREPVLAPFDGTVDSVFAAPATNRPGALGRGRAGGIVFLRDDGVRVLYAHVQDIQVDAGERVRVGATVARVGNNGPAYFPHTHVGAWRGAEPLQIRFDLSAMGTMSRRSQVGASR
jgi:murein DD-endopeptidase MepM/ murein hydrolase activator NlpD